MRTRGLLIADRAVYLFGNLILLLAVLVPAMPRAYAIPQVSDRFDQISDSTVSAVATHRFGFTYTDYVSPIGSVSFEFCTNSPVPQVPCVVPVGLDVQGATLASQAGQTGFTINSAETTANELVITRAPQAPGFANATSTYQFDDIINPDSAGSYYVRIQTYSSTDATGAAIEDGGVVFALNAAFNVSAEVPPYIKFCSSVVITDFDCTTANSFFIDFGEFAVTAPKYASSEMVLATNAGFGYTVTLSGTTLTSGNNIIPALVTLTPSSPGISQFGLNLRANTQPTIGADPVGPGLATPTPDYATPNMFKYLPGEVIISGSTTTDNRKFTASYIANVSSSQAAGVYATTISYIALANF